jgi:hypothetical protein
MAENTYPDLPLPAADTLELSRDMRALFVKYLSEFTAFDAQFSAGYAAAWLTEQQEAETIHTDEQVGDELTGLAAEVKRHTALCHATVNDLRYYATKAYGKGSARVAEFGFSQLSKSVANTGRYLVLLRVARAVATANAADLTAAGMPASVTATLGTRTLALETAEVAHQRLILRRPRLTAERYAAILKLMTRMRAVSAASDVIHASQPDKRKLFVVWG